MKIAIIVSAIRQVGPVKVFENLADELIKYPEIELEVFYLDEPIDNDVRFNVPVNQLNIRRFVFEQYDIIHTSGIRPDFIAWRCRKRIKHHISTIHNYVFPDLRYSYSRFVSVIFGILWIFIWRKANKLVVVSESLLRYYEKWIDRSKIEAILNGINVPENVKLPEDDITNFVNDAHRRGLKVLGTACELTGRKGLEQVLALLKEKREYAFVIIGKGKESHRLMKLTEKYSLADRCLFCGYRYSANRYFRLFDTYIVPSRSEGFCLALVEAVMQKVPVVCSDIEVFRELFSESEVTFFRLDNRSSLIDALDEATLFGTSKLDAAYTKARSKYNTGFMAESYLNLYMRLQR